MGDHTHAEPHGGNMTKLLFLAIGLLAFALGRPAQAADLGYPVPAHAGDTWTGFYVGGNAGYAWGSANNVLGIADDGSPFTCHFCFASDVGLAQNAGSSELRSARFYGRRTARIQLAKLQLGIWRSNSTLNHFHRAKL